MRHCLTDFTFLIPVKIDSQARVRNLQIVVDYLLKHFQTNIIIGESDQTRYRSLFWKSDWDYLVEYFFFPGSNFHRTKIINQLAAKASTEFIANYDSDVLLSEENYLQAAERLCSSEADVCYPHNWELIHLTDPYLQTIQNELSLVNVSNLHLDHAAADMLGGAIFLRKDIFSQAGMENEHITGSVFEDLERFSRYSKLGFNIEKVNGHVYHLEHPRVEKDLVSWKHNQEEYLKVNQMTEAELISFIYSWEWVNGTSPLPELEEQEQTAFTHHQLPRPSLLF